MTKLARKLALGSAQWGMDYGVSNSTGRTNDPEISRILRAARESGIDLIDTAALYGGAEQALGKQSLDGFKIVTKTPKFAKSQVTVDDAKYLLETFQRSLDFLRVDSVSGLMIHHADDLLVPGGEYLIEALSLLKNRGVAQRIGVSIYNSLKLEQLCDSLQPDIVQLPLNVIDQRLLKDGSLAYLHGKGIEVHVRSAFLQGLLLMPMSKVPGYFTPWLGTLQAWHEACISQGFTELQAAVGFLANLDSVDYLVLGVESLIQFEQILGALEKTGKVFDDIGLDSADAGLVNPVNWRL